MNKYLVTVRVKGQLIKTLVFADSATHARLLIEYHFGFNSIVNSPVKAENQVNGYQLLDEVVKAYKPLTPQQQRIKSLQTQKDNVSKQLKSERDRQKIQKAQQQIAKVRNASL
jgi:hypothetical protein